MLFWLQIAEKADRIYGNVKIADNPAACEPRMGIGRHPAI
jgi:hypothetical protein